MTTTILVVEDEASIQNIIRTYLQSAGYRVISVDNGLDALTTARQQQPDLIILDLNLPGMDGIEVAARLRQESDVYILMLTARSEEHDRVAGLRIGADDYLTKPLARGKWWPGWRPSCAGGAAQPRPTAGWLSAT